MAKALEEQRRSPDLDALSFEERVGLLVDREAAERDTKRLTTRLKFAALRQSACVEDIDWRAPRSIDRAVFAELVVGDWIDRNENLLVLDDWGLSVLTASERRDLLEILDDRHGRASTIVTSQIPVEHWHDIIGDPTLGDAILDRLVHNAHRLQLTGESMRKQNARNQTLDVVPNA